MKRLIIKTTSLLLILGLNWSGLLAVGTTLAYFNDIETSSENILEAGSLDFSLSSSGDFSPQVTPVQPSTRTISVINNGTLGFQYNIQAGDFSGELCEYLNLEANVDGDDPEYSGSLTGFSTSSIVFSEPDDWVFNLTLPQDNSIDPLQEESCQFKFVFNGWQENLPFGQGFNDTEEILNSVTAGKWVPSLLTPLDNAVINGTFVRQSWTPISGATKYIYQSCNNDPDVDGYCNQRWYEEYPEGTPQFEQASKWAPNVGNANYWWRVAAQIDSYITSYSDAWKITIDNSHLNQVVLNEFLPNPVGFDNAAMPDGEWVELYNNKGQDVDVAGWMLYDAYNSHELPITTANTNTGGTMIRSGGFLVVYRNGDADFALNNVDGDTVRLFNGEIGSGGVLIDSYSYSINALEGKSFARVPDGSNNWVDPTPTPGEPNVSDNGDLVFGTALPEEGEELTDAPVLEEPIFEEAQNEQINEQIIEENGNAEETLTEGNQTVPENELAPEAVQEIIEEIIDEFISGLQGAETNDGFLSGQDEPQQEEDSTVIDQEEASPVEEQTQTDSETATEESAETMPEGEQQIQDAQVDSSAPAPEQSQEPEGNIIEEQPTAEPQPAVEASNNSNNQSAPDTSGGGDGSDGSGSSQGGGSQETTNE